MGIVKFEKKKKVRSARDAIYDQRIKELKKLENVTIEPATEADRQKVRKKFRAVAKKKLIEFKKHLEEDNLYEMYALIGEVEPDWQI